MSGNGTAPAAITVRCKDKRGVVVYDGATPRWFRTVCRNRACCEQRDGFWAVHVFTIWCPPGAPIGECQLGAYETVYEARRPAGELIDLLEEARHTSH